ncbi:MAG: MFS transporter, partial [Limisphaerales bacterium]
VMLLAQLLSNPPASQSSVLGSSGMKSAAPGGRPSASEIDWPEMLRTARFYQLWLMFVLSASAGLMLIMHVAIIAKEQAHVDRWGFWLVALLALCNTLGRLLSGIISDRIGRSRTMLLAFILQAINMFSFSYYTTPASILFGAAFTGLCYGGIFTLFPSTTADFYGTRNLGVNYGLLFTAFGVAGVTGPYLGGKLRDIVGSYTLSYTVAAFMLLAGAALALFLQGAGPVPGTPTASPRVPDREAHQEPHDILRSV